MTRFPNGAYRRRIRLVAAAPERVEGGLEDDFHHFEVTLRHDAERVVSVDARAVRWPWSTCPGAAEPLHAIEGIRLSPRCLAIGTVTDPRLHCTHMFDLAGLCVAHAARGGGPGTTRQYDVEVPYAAQLGGEIDVQLWRDGEPALTWTLDGRRCTAPPPYAEVRWQGGFLRWADDTLAPDDAEAAIVLRRACDIGMGRGMDLDAIERADELAPLMRGVCYTMQPDQIRVALRNHGTIRDFDRDPDALLGP